MRSDNLKKHMKKHEGENEDNIMTKGLHDVGRYDNIVTKGENDQKTENNVTTNEEQISCKDEELEERVFAMERFNLKIDLGRELNKLMDKYGFTENGFDNDMIVALKIYELYGKNMDLAKKVLARIKIFERNIKLGNYLKITVDKNGYNVNELPQDMKYGLKTYDKLPQNLKDDLKTYEGVSRNMVETLKTYDKLPQNLKDDLKTKQKLKKWVWFDEPRNELHDKNHEGENGDNIVNKGGFDGKTEDNIVNKGVFDGKTEDDIVNKGVLDGKTEDNIVTNGSQIRFTREQLEEFNRKMELGRCAKLLVDEHGYNVNGLDNDMKEALKSYELHGETKSEIVNSLKKITRKAVEDLDNLQKTREKKIREKKTREKRSKLGIIKQMNNNVM